ncbi:hypothetical protein NQ314_002115 [Rhamnusium bicolor]|uniref:Mitochondrial ribosomal protein S28 n=1 Tax=Rhamnusium bicolor TaxID=1586634 RepID=A0AAV8ZT19_9CUCU|nr:hypothetical protein NQ314_002115 [Rhamnusium bicolor]
MSLLKVATKSRTILNKTKLFSYKIGSLLYSGDTNQENIEVKSGGYAKAFKKFENIKEDSTETPQTFAYLLRHSKFVDLGDPEGKVVVGKIFHIVDDDLYIDFGWKFHCVCPRPKTHSSNYVRGAKVRLLIKQLELSLVF